MGVVLALGAIPAGVAFAVAGNNSVAWPIALALGIGASLVVLLLLWLRFSQYLYLIVDRDEGVFDSLQTSLRITKGNAALIFVIYLLTFVINFAGALACFVGLIFTAPFTMLLLVVTYLALTGQKAADPFGKGEPLPELEPL